MISSRHRSFGMEEADRRAFRERARVATLRLTS